MSIYSKLFQIEKNAEDIRITILTNIVKMMTERKLLKEQNLQSNIAKLVDFKTDEQTYVIDLENDNKNYKVNKMAIKLINQKITAVNKSLGINEFLNNFKDYPKIMIIKGISKKANQYILNNYSNTEIFLEEEMMINLIDHDLVPRHILLTPEESETFYENFNCKKRNMPKIFSSDPVAKYYNMQIGDICRIIRPSETAGFAATYRLVVKGSIK